MRAPLSVIVIARDEAQNIQPCLRSVMWADERVVVVDEGSTDDTAERARSCNAHVIVRRWEGFAEAKRFAVAQTSNEWVLWLDADERVTEDLAEEIRTTLETDPPFSAYRVPRRAYFLGKWIRHCGWYPGYVVRLFRKSKARFNTLPVHEGLEVEGPVGTFHHDLLHYTDRDLQHYFRKLDRYTTLAATDLEAVGKRASAVDILLRPTAVFLKMYLLRAGFLDGMHGLVLSSLSACYVLAKYAKLWERTRVRRRRKGKGGVREGDGNAL
ncbi:MAG: glycosyltransferase family 2 protein [Bacteroidota bacterium]|nr:glycosyltransferase family 2 protein [Bacteroidota bacterium]